MVLERVVRVAAKRRRLKILNMMEMMKQSLSMVRHQQTMGAVCAQGSWARGKVMLGNLLTENAMKACFRHRSAIQFQDLYTKTWIG